jgi:hypothetical protein
MNSWLLKGLDGGNPLGFLAALGALRTVDLASRRIDGVEPSRYDQTKRSTWWMTWEATGSGWRPRLLGEFPAETDLVDLLHQELKRADSHGAFKFADSLNVPQPDFAELARAAAAASRSDRRPADFLAAFGCESVESSDKAGQIADTALRTMSGAGHQHFLGTMQKLTEDTTEDRVRRALFEPWTYSDPVTLHTMRWDPRDDVRRALRWSEPSGDPARKTQGAEWGASRLAIEGMPLLPTAPVRKGLGTTGFRRDLEGRWWWTWPIWDGRADADSARSLLALEPLQDERPDRRLLAAIGIREVYRCERITQDRYRNFTPAAPV